MIKILGVMVLTAEELVEEIIGLVCDKGVLAEEIVVYFDDDIIANASIFDELAKAEIPFGISFGSVCFFYGVKFMPWKYKNDVDYGTELVYLWKNEVYKNA